MLSCKKCDYRDCMHHPDYGGEFGPPSDGFVIGCALELPTMPEDVFRLRYPDLVNSVMCNTE